MKTEKEHHRDDEIRKFKSTLDTLEHSYNYLNGVQAQLATAFSDNNIHREADKFLDYPPPVQHAIHGQLSAHISFENTWNSFLNSLKLMVQFSVVPATLWAALGDRRGTPKERIEWVRDQINPIVMRNRYGEDLAKKREKQLRRSREIRKEGL